MFQVCFFFSSKFCFDNFWMLFSKSWEGNNDSYTCTNNHQKVHRILGNMAVVGEGREDGGGSPKKSSRCSCATCICEEISVILDDDKKICPMCLWATSLTHRRTLVEGFPIDGIPLSDVS